MNISQIAQPLDYSIYEIREMLHTTLRRAGWRLHSVGASDERTRTPTSVKSPIGNSSLSRWTREVENPFDVPTRIYGDTIK